MKKEKSCGAVVYQFQDDQLYLLILKMRKGHYSIPKVMLKIKKVKKKLL